MLLKAHWLPTALLLLSLGVTAWALTYRADLGLPVQYDVYPAPYSEQVREQVERQEVLTRQLYRTLKAREQR